MGRRNLDRKVKLNTSPPLDVDQLRQGNDLLGELLRDIQNLAVDRNQLAGLVSESMTSLAAKTGPELHAAGTSLTDSAQLQTWLQQAEGLLLARLEAEA